MLCSNCGQDRTLHKKDPPLCKSCYMKRYKRHDKPEICVSCENLCIVHRRVDSGPLCKRCWSKTYRKTYVPKERPCSACGRSGIISLNSGLCAKCYKKSYKAPVAICSMCGKLHNKYTTSNGLPICKSCRFNQRYQNEPLFATRVRLRALLGHALRRYSKTGKASSSQSYGIDYGAIVASLGPCPGQLSEYQVDHIFPLVVFNLDDPIEIRAAFAPENHRWCPKQDNLRKGAKVDRKELEAYLAKWRQA